MILILLRDRILVRKQPDNQKLKSGLIVKRKYPEGEVTQIGLKVQKLKVGDNIQFYKESGVPIDIEGETLFIMTEYGDVIGVLRE